MYLDKHVFLVYVVLIMSSQQHNCLTWTIQLQLQHEEDRFNLRNFRRHAPLVLGLHTLVRYLGIGIYLFFEYFKEMILVRVNP